MEHKEHATIILAGLLLVSPALAGEATQFIDATAASGVSFDHQTTQTIVTPSGFSNAPSDAMEEVPFLDSKAEIMSTWLTGGVAVGDYDGDGLPDIFAVGGDASTARLFRNLGNGTFEDKAADAGVDVSGVRQAGAMFVDIDGDFDLDLFVGGMVGAQPRLFRNDGENGMGETTFTDIFASAFPGYDLDRVPNNYGGSFGDYDGDGDLDVFFGHSMTPFGPSIEEVAGSTYHLWRNDLVAAKGIAGGLTFTDVSVGSGVSATFALPAPNEPDRKDHTFSPAWSDINEDGRPDLVVVSDHGETLVYRNNGDGTMADETDYSLFDGYSAQGAQNVAGMGAALGDYDNDGHFDLFISQIRTVVNGNHDGNRLYRGDGMGGFTDAGDDVGVLSGFWGWGACFGDLDQDRNLDIFHVNGFYWVGLNAVTNGTGVYSDLPAVAFMSDGDGTFTERGAELGLDDVGEGRGVSCFDYDRDGDLDVAISNHRGPFKLYQNTLNTSARRAEKGVAGAGYVNVRLVGRSPNTAGVGARIELRSTNGADTGPAQLVREIRIASNFLSSNLAEAHFGLGDWQGPFELEITWPNHGATIGQQTVHATVAANSFLEIEQLELDLPELLTFEEGGLAMLTATATGPRGDDRSAALQWAEGTVDNVVGNGASFDAFGRSVGDHPFFLIGSDPSGAATVEPFTLSVVPGSVIFADGFESGGLSRWAFATP